MHAGQLGLRVPDRRMILRRVVYLHSIRYVRVNSRLVLHAQDGRVFPFETTFLAPHFVDMDLPSEKQNNLQALQCEPGVVFHLAASLSYALAAKTRHLH